MKILIIDGDRSSQVLLSTMVRLEGNEPIVLDNPSQTMEAIETNKPSIIIMDILMPQEDGVRLLQNIKENSKTAHIPIIIISSAWDPLKEKAMKAGADIFIGKPFIPSCLEEAVRSLAEPNHAITGLLVS